MITVGKMPRLSDSSGFTIMEIVVAVALMGLIVYFSADMFLKSHDAVRGSDARNTSIEAFRVLQARINHGIRSRMPERLIHDFDINHGTDGAFSGNQPVQALGQGGLPRLINTFSYISSLDNLNNEQRGLRELRAIVSCRPAPPGWTAQFKSIVDSTNGCGGGCPANQRPAIAYMDRQIGMADFNRSGLPAHWRFFPADGQSLKGSIAAAGFCVTRQSIAGKTSIRVNYSGYYLDVGSKMKRIETDSVFGEELNDNVDIYFKSSSDWR